MEGLVEGVGLKKTKLMLYSTQLELKLKLELSLAILCFKASNLTKLTRNIIEQSTS